MTNNGCIIRAISFGFGMNDEEYYKINEAQVTGQWSLSNF